MTIPPMRDDWRPWAAERVHELKTAILFSTRLPLRRVAPISGDDLRAALWALPLAGVVVGIAGAVVYALAYRLGLSAWPAAALAVAATVALTGALHEDGLADTADGFGGGDAPERKLAIMRDSRIGTYGVCALALSIFIRASALASLADAAAAVCALIAAHAGARAVLPAVMFFVPPARSDGLSFAAGAPGSTRAAVAAVLGALVLVIFLGPGAALAGGVALAVAAALIGRLSLSQIGGQTGDVLGAVEQVGEMIVLLVALR